MRLAPGTAYRLAAATLTDESRRSLDHAHNRARGGPDRRFDADTETQSGSTVGVTQPDGTFAFWDERFTGGTVTITASFGGVTRTATAFEAPSDYPKTAAMTGYRYLAPVTVTFPPLEPTPPAPRTRRYQRAGDGG